MMANLIKLLEITTPYGVWRMWQRGEVSLLQVVLFYLGLMASVLALFLIGLFPRHGSEVTQFVFVNMAMFSVLCGSCDDLLAVKTRRKRLWFKFSMAPFMMAPLLFSLGWIDIFTGTDWHTCSGVLRILGVLVDLQGDHLILYVVLSSMLGVGYAVRWLFLLRDLVQR